MRTLATLAALAAALGLAACPPDGALGDACETTGDGFTKVDPCAEMCLDWEVTCPGGTTVDPGVCTGPVCGAGGTCPSGQLCLQVDSFADNSRCVPAWICPAPEQPAAPASAPAVER